MTLELDSRQRAMLQEMGIKVWLQEAPAMVATPEQAVAAPPVPRPAPVSVPVPVPRVTAGTSSLQQMDASALAQAAAVCTACRLCAGRKQSTLQGRAIQQTDWMLVGDPPDEDEDREGIPFAQHAGLLLDNMLRAVGKDRHAFGAAGAYLSNAVKCRPPHGYVPQSEELTQCEPYLQREIALVQPKVIIAMGRFAHQTLLSENPQVAVQPIGKLRGVVYRYQNIPVVVTYAPRELLRRSADKGKAWADLCLAIDAMKP